MRIGLTGSGATGKSSLLQALREDEYFKDFTFCGSVAREVFKKHGLSTETDQYQRTPEQNMLLQRDILATKCVQQNNVLGGLNVISDRILLDHYAYLCVRNTDVIDNDFFHSTKKAVEHNIAQYDIIFYFEMFDDVRTEGFRDDSDTVRYTVDAVILRTLTGRRVSTKVVTVYNHLDVPQRVDLTKAIIDEFRRNRNEI